MKKTLKNNQIEVEKAMTEAEEQIWFSVGAIFVLVGIIIWILS